MTLGGIVGDAAAKLSGVERRDSDGGTEWSIGGALFATVSRAPGGTPERAEFRLDPVVLRAALGTPDTARSPRGDDWVAFSPPDLDRIAIDRAIAWLGSAHRRAFGR